MSKKDEIIDAAVREFGENSYDAASINRIIKASGTSKGTFYHYFKDKKSLYFAIIDEAMKTKHEYLSVMLNEIAQGSDFFDMMKAQAKAAAAFVDENPGLYKFGMMYASEQGPIKSEVAERYITGVGDTYQKIIAAGLSNNNFTDRYPSDFIVRIIFYMTMNYYDILFDKNEKPSMDEVEKRLDMMFDFLKRGFS